LQNIGLWVIGGGGVDTERRLHFNYSHQLSRKPYKQLSCQTKHSTNYSHLTLSTPPSNQCEAAAAVSHRQCPGAAAIVVDKPLSSLWSHHHCRGAAAVVVEPSPSLLSRRCFYGAATVVNQPPWL